jgi:integrase/recombinase XerD
MVDLHVRATGALNRFRSSPVWTYVDGFANALHERGYSRPAAVAVIGDAVHLGRWADREGRSVAALDESTVEAFLAHLPGCRCPGRRRGRPICVGAHARAFLDYLRDCDVVPAAALPSRGAPGLVSSFCDWMVRHRGVTRTTLGNYVRVASGLVACLGKEPSRYDAAGLRAALHEVGGGGRVGAAKCTATVARAFVRYLAMEGRCRPGLEAAILPVANWSLASLPRYVSAEAVQQIINAGGAARRCGVRDRAILLLLARLGLRGSDIVRMRLCDIDWRRGCVSVAGKGRREVRLPLP